MLTVSQRAAETCKAWTRIQKLETYNHLMLRYFAIIKTLLSKCVINNT